MSTAALRQALDNAQHRLTPRKTEEKLLLVTAPDRAAALEAAVGRYKKVRVLQCQIQGVHPHGCSFKVRLETWR